jgi:hypothetical protein
MGVNFSRLDIRMSQLLLHGADITTALQQMGRKRMAQCMRTHIFTNPGVAGSGLNNTVKRRFIQVVLAY